MAKFLKGVSGNPNGRPKNTKHLSDALQDILLSTELSINFVINGNKRKVTLESDKTLAYGVAAKLVGSALEGNIRAIQTIFDRLEGKPLQSFSNDIDLNSSDVIINF